ncbi:MAG: FG-GAP repeat protein [Deltaproteobacteria bacterium]|nr:FG-GAP repeat protein [Deltaproteobacteria bacterium]
MGRSGRRTGRGAAAGAARVATALGLLLAAACGRSLYSPPACSDGIDNDGDGRTDLADPQCSDPGDDDEGPAGDGGGPDDGESGADGDADIGSDVDAEVGPEVDVEADGEAEADAGPDGEADADGLDDGDADDAGDDGEVYVPCEDGRPCVTMPLGRCVSGACASVWESTTDGDRLGQAVALQGARSDAAPRLVPGHVLVGAPEAVGHWGHAALRTAATWSPVVSWDGATALERFGWAVAIGPDLGGTTGLTLTVGTMTGADPALWGRVAIYGLATASGPPVQELTGPAEGSAFGTSLAWGPDVSGDDVEDLVVGAPTYRTGSDTLGAAMLYSGGTWVQLQSWSGTSGSQFGKAVARGPAGGSGRPAMTLVGAPGVDSTYTDDGCAYLYEGTGDGWIWWECGEGLQASFGAAVAAGTDANGDGDGDFAVGSPGFDDGIGRVYLRSLAGLLRSWSGEAEGDDFGWSVALGPDADGRPGGELLVGAPGVASDRGRVYLFRFDQDAPLRTWDGEASGDRFGCAVSLGGDVDGDGRADALVGACGTGSSPGKVYLFGSASW